MPSTYSSAQPAPETKPLTMNQWQRRPRPKLSLWRRLTSSTKGAAGGNSGGEG